MGFKNPQVLPRVSLGYGFLWGMGIAGWWQIGGGFSYL